MNPADPIPEPTRSEGVSDVGGRANGNKLKTVGLSRRQLHTVRRNLVPLVKRPWMALCRSTVAQEDRCRLLPVRRGCIFHKQRGSYATDPLVVGQVPNKPGH
jgi:hypothetical protein